MSISHESSHRRPSQQQAHPLWFLCVHDGKLKQTTFTRSKSTFEIPCASSLPRLLERKETKHYASLTVLLLPVSLERRRRNESSQCTACSKKKIWRASHNCRHPSIPEARKLKTNRKRAWVLGECQGVGRGMCYAGHGWSVIDSNKGHICVAIKSFNSS